MSTSAVEPARTCALDCSCRADTAISEATAQKDEQIKALKTANDGLRRRIHQLEKHNQHFERCESSWCNPSPGEPPTYYSDVARWLSHEVATRKDAEIARLVEALEHCRESLQQIKARAMKDGNHHLADMAFRALDVPIAEPRAALAHHRGDQA
jgi:hypothetical protein